MKAQKTRQERMLASLWEIILLLALITAAIKVARAGTVRTIYVDSKTMSPIHLRLGESTLLRFNEKPKKVVIGNQNYFNIEFIENDVTIQPLGRNSTNLFVYGEDHTYGFLLNVSSAGYDDLVLVKWKGVLSPRAREPVQTPPPLKSSSVNIRLDLGKKIQMFIEKVQGPTLFGTHTVDFLIENDLPVEIKTSEVVINFLDNAGNVYKGEWVFSKEKIAPRSKIHGRFIGKVSNLENLTVVAQYLGIKGKAKILRKFL